METPRFVSAPIPSPPIETGPARARAAPKLCSRPFLPAKIRTVRDRAPCTCRRAAGPAERPELGGRRTCASCRIPNSRFRGTRELHMHKTTGRLARDCRAPAEWTRRLVEFREAAFAAAQPAAGPERPRTANTGRAKERSESVDRPRAEPDATRWSGSYALARIANWNSPRRGGRSRRGFATRLCGRLCLVLAILLKQHSEEAVGRDRNNDEAAQHADQKHPGQNAK